MHGLLILLIVIFVFCFLFLIGILVYQCIKRSDLEKLKDRLSAISKLDGKSSGPDSETDQQYSNKPLLQSDPENEIGPPGYINDEAQEKPQEYAYRRPRKVDRNISVRNYDTYTIEAETGGIHRNYNGDPKKPDVTSVDEIKEENPDEQVQIINNEIQPIQYNQNLIQENDVQEKHQEETIAIENKNVENLEKSVNLENKVHIFNHLVEVNYPEEKGEVQNDEQIVQENQNDDQQYQNDEKLRTSLVQDERWEQEIKEVQAINNEIEQSQHNQNLLNENDAQENSITESTEYIQNKESQKDANYYVEEHETNRNLENQPQIMETDEDGDGENKDEYIVKDNQNDDQFRQENITGSNQEVLQQTQSLKRAREEEKEEESPELPKKGKTDKDEGEEIVKDLENLIKDSKIAGDYNHCRELCERLQFLEDKIQNIQFSNLEKEKLQQLKQKLNERTKAFDNFGGVISEVLEYERKLDGFDKSVEDFDGDNSDLEYFNLEESLRKGFLYLKTLNTKEVSEEYNNKKIECMKTLRKLREKLFNKTNVTLNTDEEKSEHYTKKIKKVISKAEKLQEELDKLEGDEHYFRESLNKYMEEVDKIDFEPVRENKREAIRTIKKVYDSLVEKVKANSFQVQNSDDNDDNI